MNNTENLELFACIECGHNYTRHQLRETFCDNCDEILKVEKLFTMPTGLGIEGMRKFIKECANTEDFPNEPN